MFDFVSALVASDTLDFTNLVDDLGRQGALSLDQIASDPRDNSAVQDEVDYLGRDARAETDSLNRDAQAEIDYYNQLNQTGAWDAGWF